MTTLFTTSTWVTAAAVISLWAAPSIVGIDSGMLASQESEAQANNIKRVRVPALRSRVYELLANAQSLADGGDREAAIAILDSVQERDFSMNSYELAMMHNFYGFIYYNAEEYDEAIAAFKRVVDQSPIPVKFEQTTLFSLSQLSMMRGNYDDTVMYLERWESLQQGNIPAKNLVLKAQAMYQKKDFEQALTYINQAIEERRNSELGFKVEENWYILQRAIYYEMKQPEKVRDVLLVLLREFEQPKYWIQLAGMYGELGQEEEQLAIMESAYQQGYITNPADVFNLAQLYYYHQVPYKGARLMEQAINTGVLERNLRNMKFLAQSWTLAKENEKAVPAMQEAAGMSEDGELDAQLAQIFLNMERWQDAIDAAQVALKKGELQNPGYAHLILGMALFNQGQYALALNQLAEAEKFNSSRGMARQWKRFVESEKQSAEALSSIAAE